MAEALKTQGNQYFAAKKYKEAIVAYSAAIEIDDANAIYFSNRSAAHFGAGDFEAALQDADKSLKIDETFAKGFIRKGKAERALGRPAHGEKTFLLGLKKKPEDELLKMGYQEFIKDEDGDQSRLYGMDEVKVVNFQADQGMQMHTEEFIRALPSRAHECAFLGDFQGFKKHWKPKLHSNMRAWKVKLPIVSVIVSGEQRVSYMSSTRRPCNPEYSSIMKYVLEQGHCRTDAKDIGGYTALAHASGHHVVLPLALILLEFGADASTRNRFGATPLFTAIRFREFEAAQMLLDAGSDPRASIATDGSTIEMVAQLTDPRMLAMVHEKLNLNQENKDAVPGGSCGHCGKIGAKQRCGGCRFVLYCNRDCQRVHWKLSHKKKCGASTTSSSSSTGGGENKKKAATTVSGDGSDGILTVKLESPAGANMYGKIVPRAAVNDIMAKSMGMKESVPGEGDLASKSYDMKDSSKTAKTKSMIVKVQVCLNPFPGSDHMFIYNQTRNFQGSVAASTFRGKLLDSLIRRKGILGQKAYFIGYVENQGELTLRIDKMLPAQPW